MEEFQDEAKKVTGIIHPVHQNVRNIVEIVEKVMPEHVRSDLVEKLQEK